MTRWSIALLLLATPLAAQSPAPLALSLGDALQRAVGASPTVGIAHAGVTNAQGAVLRARSGYLPQINGSVLYSRTLASEFSAFANSESSDTFPTPTGCHHFVPDPALPIDQRVDSLEHAVQCAASASPFNLSDLPFGQANTWTFGLSGSQTIFDRRLIGQIAAANAGKDQAAIEYDVQRAQAVLTAAQTYFDAQLAQRLVDIADSTLAQAQRTLDQTTLQHQVGNAAEFDQLRASVARNNQTPVVLQREAARDQAFLRLRQALDLPANVPITLTTPLEDTAATPLPDFAARVAAAHDTSIAGRAPVREAQASVRQSEGQLTAARAERLPALSVSSTYAKIDFPADVFSFNRFLTNWTVDVQLTVPIFNGGRLRGDELVAEAQRETADMRLKQARQQAQLEQGDAVTQLQSAEAQFSASVGTVTQAQRAYDIAELRYQNGLSTLTDVGDARLQLGQAQANAAQGARDVQVARLRLLLLPALPFSEAGANGSVPASANAAPTAGSTTNPTAPVVNPNSFFTGTSSGGTPATGGGPQ